jgi:SAM-dependent methyltransferase
VRTADQSLGLNDKSRYWSRSTLLALHRLVRHLINVPALPGLVWKNLRHLRAPQRSAPVQARRSVPTEYFEAVYARDPDPWNYRTSAYEEEKYAATLAALCKPRFHRGFDIGCSIGVLTQRLAKRCDQLLAIDAVEAALVQARTTCSDEPHVKFARMRIPDEWPYDRFDLIVISEVLYYLDPSDIRRTAAACLRSLEPEGTIILVNYLPPNKRKCYADEAVTLFCSALHGRCESVSGYRAELYRLDVLRAME